MPRILVLLGAALLALAIAPPPIVIDAQPRIGQAHGDLRLVVTVERDPQNRSLIVVADNGRYLRRSDEALADATHAGDEAARVREVRFRSMPEGVYDVAAYVLRADGTQRQTHIAVCFLGPTTSAEDCP